MKNLLLIITYSLIITSISLPQGTAGEQAKYEYKYLIDMPVAGVLEKGFVAVAADVMRSGVLIAFLDVGVFENVSFGIEDHH